MGPPQPPPPPRKVVLAAPPHPCCRVEYSPRRSGNILLASKGRLTHSFFFEVTSANTRQGGFFFLLFCLLLWDTMVISRTSPGCMWPETGRKWPDQSGRTSKHFVHDIGGGKRFRNFQSGRVDGFSVDPGGNGRTGTRSGAALSWFFCWDFCVKSREEKKKEVSHFTDGSEKLSGYTEGRAGKEFC